MLLPPLRYSNMFNSFQILRLTSKISKVSELICFPYINCESIVCGVGVGGGFTPLPLLKPHKIMKSRFEHNFACGLTYMPYLERINVPQDAPFTSQFNFWVIGWDLRISTSPPPPNCGSELQLSQGHTHSNRVRLV